MADEKKLEATPVELWLLRGCESGNWIRSADDEVSLVCQTNEADAKAAAEYTEDHWDIPCEPVRVL